MTYRGLNFRQNLATVTDGPNDAPFTTSPTQDKYPVFRNGLKYGYLASTPFSSDDLSKTDVRLKGYARAYGGFQRWRLDLIKGATYKCRWALGDFAKAQSFSIWDGEITDPIYGASTTDIFNGMLYYSAGMSVSVGKYIITGVGANCSLYRCSSITSGVTGGVKPTHKSGTADDGGVSWEYIRSALWACYNGSPVSPAYVDAKGNTLTATSWGTDNLPSDAWTLTDNNFITGMCTSDSPVNSVLIHHFSYEQVPGPLKDCILYDEEGNDVTSNLTLYANQPPGKLVAKIGFVSGEFQSSTWQVTGTLGGNASNYFEVVTRNGEYWIRTTNLRLPDNATGTFIVKQTESDSQFSGSPHNTTIPTTVVSSRGRPTGTDYWGLISTQCYLRYMIAKDRSDQYFQGAENVTSFPDGDVVVTTATQLVAYANGTNGLFTPGSGRKFRIRVKKDPANPTAWDAGLVLGTVARDYAAGGGCLVIEPMPGFEPTLVNRWFINKDYWKGVEFRGFTFVVPGAGLIVGGIYSQLVVRNCTFIDSTWKQDTDKTNSTSGAFITGSDMECLRVIGCKFLGGFRHLYFTNVSFCELAYSDGQQSKDDFADSTTDGGHYGRYSTDDMVYWVHDNMLSNCLNIDNGNHVDFTQYSTTLVYPGGAFGATANTTTKLNEYKSAFVPYKSMRQVGNRLYQNANTSGGNTAYRPDASNPSPPLPSHTSGFALDGGVNWEYKMTVDQFCKLWLVVHDNIILQSTSFATATQCQFIINSNSVRWPMAVFNNIVCTIQQRGVPIESSIQTEPNFVEYNTLVGPPDLPVGGAYVGQVIQNGPVVAGPCKVRAYKNICDGIGAGTFDEDNLIVSGRSGALVGQRYIDNMRGTFTQGTDGHWRYDANDTGTLTIDQMKDAISKTMHPTSGRYGARGKEKWTAQIRVQDSTGKTSNVLDVNFTVLP